MSRCQWVQLLCLLSISLEVLGMTDCDPLEMEDLLTLNRSGNWEFNHTKESISCFRSFNSEQAMRLLNGKTILFVGDSTVRNVALSLTAFLCNPERMENCANRLHWPFEEDAAGIDHALSCRRSTPKFGPKKESVERNAEFGWCMNPKWLGFSQIAIPSLTSENYTTSRAERKQFWRKGKVPAVLDVKVMGIRFLILEAGCAKRNDGLDNVLRWLINDEKHRSKNTAALPNWDLLFTSSGMHCTYADYSKQPTWFNKVSALIIELKQMSKKGVIWLEATNCTKKAAPDHWFTPGKNGARGSGSGARLNVNKYASCPYMEKYRFQVREAIKRSEAMISPTFFMTGGPKSRSGSKEGCPFADHIHPGVKCYKDLLQIHLNTLRVAFDGELMISSHSAKKIETVAEVAITQSMSAQDSSHEASNFSALLILACAAAFLHLARKWVI